MKKEKKRRNKKNLKLSHLSYYQVREKVYKS